MAQYELNVQSRTQTGKGAARQLRMKNQLPAVLYGHKEEPIKFALDRKEFTDLVHKHGSNSLLVLTGDGGGETAFIKAMQKHYVQATKSRPLTSFAFRATSKSPSKCRSFWSAKPRR